jgi:hypothetical protein
MSDNAISWRKLANLPDPVQRAGLSWNANANLMVSQMA